MLELDGGVGVVGENLHSHHMRGRVEVNRIPECRMYRTDEYQSGRAQWQNHGLPR